MSTTLIRRYNVQKSGIGGWYDVSDALPRAAALAELKAARAESKRSRSGSTFRLRETPSVRGRVIKLANPCHCAPKRKSPCACSGHKVANPRGTPKAPAREKADANGDFPYVSVDGNMSPTTQAKLKALLASRAPANYPIETHYNSEDAKTLRRRKVESNGHGQYGKDRYLISRTRLPGLLIAMIRSGKEDEYDLASSMLSTLQIELV